MYNFKKCKLKHESINQMFSANLLNSKMTLKINTYIYIYIIALSDAFQDIFTSI